MSPKSHQNEVQNLSWTLILKIPPICSLFGDPWTSLGLIFGSLLAHFSELLAMKFPYDF